MLYLMNKDLSYMQLVLPQRHGQNLYKQNIATYSQELAKDIGDIDGYDETAFAEDEKFETEAGRFFNQNWAPVDTEYKGQHIGICMERVD